MKDRLIEALEESPYIDRKDISKPRLLVYLMGPYTSHPPYRSPNPSSRAATSRKTLDEALQQLSVSAYRGSNVATFSVSSGVVDRF